MQDVAQSEDVVDSYQVGERRFIAFEPFVRHCQDYLRIDLSVPEPLIPRPERERNECVV